MVTSKHRDHKQKVNI